MLCTCGVTIIPKEFNNRMRWVWSGSSVRSVGSVKSSTLGKGIWVLGFLVPGVGEIRVPGVGDTGSSIESANDVKSVRVKRGAGCSWRKMSSSVSLRGDGGRWVGLGDWVFFVAGSGAGCVGIATVSTSVTVSRVIWGGV